MSREARRKAAHAAWAKWHKRVNGAVAKVKEWRGRQAHATKHARFWRAQWEKLRPPKGPRIDPRNPNKVIGGTKRQRVVFAARQSEQRSGSNSFYSQKGGWDIKHGITGPSRDKRSDCSSWVTAMFWSAGLPDPNGQNYTGGYTGTLVSHCHEIARSKLKPGDLVIYGPGPGHHVELYVGPGDATIGHGSPPIDAGTIDMLSGARFFRPPCLD